MMIGQKYRRRQNGDSDALFFRIFASKPQPPQLRFIRHYSRIYLNSTPSIKGSQCLRSMSSYRDPYDILGVPRGSSLEGYFILYHSLRCFVTSLYLY